ncbi:hypothetical protein ACFO0N_09000 [Halobium salinum]|uniref:Lipoprotein n=1 Tax=Halobium salinum TaxID=1364940 RepID=A0ABD5PBP2_9EURY|nr:hypothetical protein [Halobium salinum]
MRRRLLLVAVGGVVGSAGCLGARGSGSLGDGDRATTENTQSTQSTQSTATAERSTTVAPYGRLSLTSVAPDSLPVRCRLFHDETDDLLATYGPPFESGDEVTFADAFPARGDARLVVENVEYGDVLFDRTIGDYASYDLRLHAGTRLEVAGVEMA